jgi:hypothetical protein
LRRENDAANTGRAGGALQPKPAVSAGSDQAVSTAGGKNATSVQTAGSPPSCTCQLPFANLVNRPMEAPSSKPAKTLKEAVRDGKKSARAQ